MGREERNRFQDCRACNLCRPTSTCMESALVCKVLRLGTAPVPSAKSFAAACPLGGDLRCHRCTVLALIRPVAAGSCTEKLRDAFENDNSASTTPWRKKGCRLDCA